MKLENIEILKNGGVGVIPTDTIYGLVGRADMPETVARIARIKNRADGKGFIVLISSVEDLKLFGIEISDNVSFFLNKFWPGKVSVEVSYNSPEFKHLRRPEGCNAFRLSDQADLLATLRQTGPLVAPSANISNEPPAKNIKEAEKYFGLAGREGGVDFYEDAGELDSAPSTLVKIIDDKIEILRQGAVHLDPAE